MILDLLKFAFSALRGRAGGILKTIWTHVRKGWSALDKIVRHGVGHLLNPDLDPVTRSNIDRLRARAEAELRRRAEKEAREHVKTEQGRADLEAAKKAMAEAEAQAKAAGATEEEAKKAAAAVKIRDESAILVRMPSFDANANVRVASVIQLAAPFVIKSVVRALANMPKQRACEEALDDEAACAE